MKTAIVIGSTGLVGTELVKELQASSDYSKIVLLSRRSVGFRDSKVVEKIIDFAAPDLAGVSGDDFYCALGTTRRKAGSVAAQYQVDYEYPVNIASRLRAQGVSRVFLVSSVGAKAGSSNFYLRTKGQLEDTIIKLGFEQIVIARPSFLIGRRPEFRTGEEVALRLMKLLSPLMVGTLRKYRGIEASLVARCLVRVAESGGTGVRYIESDRIRDLDGF